MSGGAKSGPKEGVSQAPPSNPDLVLNLTLNEVRFIYDSIESRRDLPVPLRDVVRLLGKIQEQVDLNLNTPKD